MSISMVTWEETARTEVPARAVGLDLVDGARSSDPALLQVPDGQVKQDD
jgi:hypothetical protein